MSSPEHHSSQRTTYNVVFAALIVLLVLTVLAAEIDNPTLNVVAAVAIATTKAVLIVLYFMHVRHSTPLTQVIAVSGFVWLLILFLFTLSDFVTRGWT